MFDVIFDSAIAFNQAGMLIAAFFCLGLGGLILGNGLYWRLKALRVEGTVIGVRKKKNTYRPVYRYMLPSGETVEATSDTGSSLVRGKETGSVHPLLVFADDPENVRPAHSVVFGAIGIFLLIPGFVFLKVALTAYDINGYTFAMLGGIGAYVGIKLKKNLIPKEQRAPLKDWRLQRLAKRRAKLAEFPVRPIEEYLSSVEGLAEKAQADKTRRWLAPLLTAVSLGMIWGGLYTGNRQLALDQHGLRSTGTVIRLEESRGSDSTSYYPVVRFENQRGHKVEFKDSMGSSPPLYRRGEKVGVLYLADDPENTAAIDKGIYNWALPLALLIFGVLLLAVSLGMFRHMQRDEAR